ncbi:MAG: nucleoside-diphosphate kinase [Ichthyobacteriaceae bacterium]|nr:nucleoside-diphosphate kinase [Ichthyobacteriaceae bacterium]
MTGDITFSMIKPGAVGNGFIGPILDKITSAGFTIVALRMTQMTRSEAEAFYYVHKERPFFTELVEFMVGGPIVAVVLKKENAVEDFRTLIGATNPEEAAEGTIRKMYAESLGHNAIHGSDSDDNAKREVSFHFSTRKIFYNCSK